MNNKNWFNENIETYEVSVWHRIWVKYRGGLSNWFIDTLLLVLIVIALALIWDII